MELGMQHGGIQQGREQTYIMESYVMANGHSSTRDSACAAIVCSAGHSQMGGPTLSPRAAGVDVVRRWCAPIDRAVRATLRTTPFSSSVSSRPSVVSRTLVNPYLSSRAASVWAASASMASASRAPSFLTFSLRAHFLYSLLFFVPGGGGSPWLTWCGGGVGGV